MCALPVEKSVPLRLDGQAGADEVTCSAEIIALHLVQRVPERLVRVEVKVLVFEAENHVDQWPFMDHVVEPAADWCALADRSSLMKLEYLLIAAYPDPFRLWLQRRGTGDRAR